jgi:hypothetical protein
MLRQAIRSGYARSGLNERHRASLFRLLTPP